LVAVAVAAVVVLGLVVSALQLSGTQWADLSLDSSDAAVGVADVRLGEDRTELDARLEKAVRDAGGEDVSVDYFTLAPQTKTGAGRSLSFTEIGDVASESRRISLVAGRYPLDVGEVMVSSSLAEELPIGSTLQLFSGALTLTVVGEFDDLFNMSSRRLIVPRGTWSSMRVVSAEEAGRLDYAAGVRVRWRGKDAVESGIEAVAALTGTTVESLWEGDWVETREEIESHQSFRDAATTIATWGGPALGGLLSGLFAGTFLARTRRAMWTVGVPRSRTSGAAMLALVISTVGGGLVGLAVGVAAGFAARPFVAQVAGKPAGPPSGIVDVLAPMILAPVLAVVGAVVVSATADRWVTPRVEQETARTSPVYSLALACVLIAGGVFVTSVELSRSSLTAGAAFIACGVIVGATGAVVGAISRVRARGFAPRLAIRKLAAERRVTTFTVIALAVLQTIGLSLIMVVGSTVDGENADTEAQVPPGHILIEPSLSANPNEIRTSVEEYTGISDPVRFQTLEGFIPARDGTVFVIDGEEDVARLIGRDLSAAEAEVLDGDGILFTGPPDLDEVHVVTAEDVADIPRYAVLEGIDPSFRNYSGFIREATADHANLDVNPEDKWQYVGASAEQVRLAAESANALGFATDYVVVYVPPDVIVPSVRSMATSLLASLLAVAVLVTSAGAQIRSLRPDLAGLRAVGVDSRFLARVTAIRVGVMVAVATALAVVSVAAGTGIVLSILANRPLSIPWTPVAAFVGSIAASGAVATWWSSRRLRAMDRG
jgi:hypothetical protein